MAGDAGVGKRALVNRWGFNQFEGPRFIGVEFASRAVEYANRTVKLYAVRHRTQK